MQQSGIGQNEQGYVTHGQLEPASRQPITLDMVLSEDPRGMRLRQLVSPHLVGNWRSAPQGVPAELVPDLAQLAYLQRATGMPTEQLLRAMRMNQWMQAPIQASRFDPPPFGNHRLPPITPELLDTYSRSFNWRNMAEHIDATVTPEYRRQLGLDAVPARRTGIIPDNILSLGSEDAVIRTLLENNRGIAFADEHSDVASVEALTKRLGMLRERGVTTLFVEMVRSNFQDSLDTFMRTGDPFAPDAQGYTLDRQGINDRWDTYAPGQKQNYFDLISEARRQGMRVIGIDTVDANGERYSTSNEHWAETVERHAARMPPGERFAVFGGRNHFAKGVSTGEYTGLSVSDMLNIPTVEFTSLDGRPGVMTLETGLNDASYIRMGQEQSPRQTNIAGANYETPALELREPPVLADRLPQTRPVATPTETPRTGTASGDPAVGDNTTASRTSNTGGEGGNGETASLRRPVTSSTSILESGTGEALGNNALRPQVNSNGAANGNDPLAASRPISQPSPDLANRLANIETRLNGGGPAMTDLGLGSTGGRLALSGVVLPDRFPAQPLLDVSDAAYAAAPTTEAREGILRERLRRTELPVSATPGFQLPARTPQEQALLARMNLARTQGSEEYQSRMRLNVTPGEIAIDGQGPRSLLTETPLARAPGSSPLNMRIGALTGLEGTNFNLTGGIGGGGGGGGVEPPRTGGRRGIVGEAIGPFAGLAMGTMGVISRDGTRGRAEDVQHGLDSAGFGDRTSTMLTGERAGAVMDYAVMAPDAPLAANMAARLATGGQGFLSRGAAGALGKGSLLLAAGWTALEMANAREAQDGQREAGALYGLLGGVATGAAGGAVGGPWGALIGGIGGGFLASEYGRRSSLGDQMQRNLDRRAQLAVDVAVSRIQSMQRTLAEGGQLSDRDKADLRSIVPALIEQYHRLRVLPLAETDGDGQMRRDFEMRQIARTLQFIDPRTPNAQRLNFMPYTSGQITERVQGQLPALLAQINANPQWRDELALESYILPAGSDEDVMSSSSVAMDTRPRFGHQGPPTVDDLMRLVRATRGLDLYMLDTNGDGLTAQELMEGLQKAGAIGRVAGEDSTPLTPLGDAINDVLSPEVRNTSPERRREYYAALRRIVPDPRTPGVRAGIELRNGSNILEQFVENERRISLRGTGPTEEETQMQELLAAQYFEDYYGGDMAEGMIVARQAINRSRPLYPNIEDLDRAGIGALLPGDKALRNVENGAYRFNSEDFAHNLRVIDNLLIADGIDDTSKEMALDTNGDGVLSVEEYMAGLSPEHQAQMRAFAPQRGQQLDQAAEARRAEEARVAADRARVDADRARGAELYAQNSGGGITVTGTLNQGQRNRRARDLVDSIRPQLSPELVAAMDKDIQGQPGFGTVERGEFQDFAREAGVTVDLDDRNVRRNGLSAEDLAKLNAHRERLGHDIGTAATAQLDTQMIAAIDRDNSHTINIEELGRFMRDNNIVDANGQDISFANLEAELQRNNGQIPTVLLEQIRLTVAARNGGDSGGGRGQ